MKNFTILLIILLLNVSIVIYFFFKSPSISEITSREKKIEAAIVKQFEVDQKSLILSSPLLDSIQKYMHSNVLFCMYFGSNSCGSCVDNAIADLISLKKTLGKKNILVIVSEDNEKSAKLMMNTVKDYFNTLCVKKNELKFDGINESLHINFFLLDHSMKPFCLYFYMPEFPSLNREYFNIVAKRLLLQQ